MPIHDSDSNAAVVVMVSDSAVQVSVTATNNSCLSVTKSFWVYPFNNHKNTPNFSTTLLNGRGSLEVIKGEPAISLLNWLSPVPSCSSSVGINNDTFGAVHTGCNPADGKMDTVTLNPSRLYPYAGTLTDKSWQFFYEWIDNKTLCSSNYHGRADIFVFPAPTVTMPAFYKTCKNVNANLKAIVNWSARRSGRPYYPNTELWAYWYHHAGAVYGVDSPAFKIQLFGSIDTVTHAVPGDSNRAYSVIIVAKRKKYWGWYPDVPLLTVPTVVTIIPQMQVDLKRGGSIVNSQSVNVCANSTLSALKDSISSYDTLSKYTITWTRYSDTCTSHCSGTVISGPTTVTSATSTYTPTRPGVYTVLITDTRTGCIAQRTFTYQTVHPNLDISVGGVSGVKTGYLCPGGTASLTGNSGSSSSQTYQWYRNGTLISGATSYIYNTTQKGTYRYIATMSNSPYCTDTSDTVVVIDPPALTLIGGSFSGSSGNVFINVPSPAYFSTYDWYYNGSPLSGYTGTTRTSYSPAAAGYYQVTSAGCGGGIVYSNIVKLGNSCGAYGSGTVFSNHTFTSNQTLSGTVLLQGTTTINPGVIINIASGANIEMDACAEIYIKKSTTSGIAGGNLVINSGATIQGCSGWDGILVEGDPTHDKTSNQHGQLTINGTSGSPVTIEDANTAIYSKDGGSLSISHTIFQYNGMHIAIGSYYNSSTSTYYDHQASISNCTFSYLQSPDCTTPMFTPSYTKDNNPMVYMESTGGVAISNSTFDVPVAGVSTDGINAFNVQEFTRGGTKIGLNLSSNTFDEALQTCAYISTGVGIEMTANTFGHTTGSGTHPVNGVYMHGVTDGAIGDGTTTGANKFYYLTNGLQYYNAGTSSSTVTNVQHNDFEYNSYAIVIAPDVYPITTGAGTPINLATGTIQINLACNKILFNGFGIIGSGSLRDQGTISSEAGNNFDGGLLPSATSGSTNSNADILWIGNLPATSYYRYTSSATLKTLSGTIDINYTTHSGSANFTVSSGSFACWGTWKRSETDLVEQKENSDFKVYPNPSDYHFTIEMPNTGTNMSYVLEVWDILGQRVFLQNISSDQNILTLNAQNWAPGTYQLIIKSDNEQLYQQHLVKQGAALR
jgi:hypothetical protein